MQYGLLVLIFTTLNFFGLNLSRSETIQIELNSGSLRLRQTPNADAESCGTVSNGSNLTLISSSNGWYQVRTNSPDCPTAWVHSYFTSEYYDGPQSRDFLNSWNPTTTRIDLGEGQLRLRNQPRSNSSTCGTIDNGTQVEKLTEDDGWFLIRTNNRSCPTAWIHGYYTEGQYQGPQTDSFLRSWRPSDVAAESASETDTPRYDVTVSTKNIDALPVITDAEARPETPTEETGSTTSAATLSIRTDDLNSLTAAEREFYRLPSAGEFKLDPSQRTEAGFCIDCINRGNIVPEDFPVLAEGLSGVENSIGWNVTSADRQLGGRCISDKETLQNQPRPTLPNLNQEKILSIESNLQNRYGVNPIAFQRTLAFYRENTDIIKNARYMTIVDMSQPAENHRKFLIDLETGNIEGYYVSHGRGSDPNQTGEVQNFGNTYDSNRTPSGFHLTGIPYDGKYGGAGDSLPLHGQEEGTNDQSCRRAVVIHKALGNGGIASSDESIGNRWRSNGCFAMNASETRAFIDRVKNGSVYYVYDGN